MLWPCSPLAASLTLHAGLWAEGNWDPAAPLPFPTPEQPEGRGPGLRIAAAPLRGGELCCSSASGILNVQPLGTEKVISVFAQLMRLL